MDYEAVEDALRQAFELVRGSLAPQDAQLVSEFLGAAEYGLAFKTLAGALVEANAPLSQEFCASMREAARRMNYPDDFSDLDEPEVAAALILLWESCREGAE